MIIELTKTEVIKLEKNYKINKKIKRKLVNKTNMSI